GGQLAVQVVEHFTEVISQGTSADRTRALGSEVGQPLPLLLDLLVLHAIRIAFGRRLLEITHPVGAGGLDLCAHRFELASRQRLLRRRLRLIGDRGLDASETLTKSLEFFVEQLPVLNQRAATPFLLEERLHLVQLTRELLVNAELRLDLLDF